MEKKLIAMNGMRPTGNLHLGHYTSALKMTYELQESNTCSEIYEMIADDQALTDNFDNPQKVIENVLEVTLDYLAGGLDPNKTCIFVQSQVPALKEMTFYFFDLVTLARLERNPTVKTELQQKDFKNNIPMGFLSYPISQSADILAFETDIVPVGEDQAPMIEQCNEIAHKFNSLYGNNKEILHPCKIYLPKNQASLRLPGTDGKAKMSKSLNNCIYLKDDEKTIRQKVSTMYTDPNHLKVEDPGDTKNNPVFIYLDAFANNKHFKTYYPEFSNLNELKKAYEKGGIGDVRVKRFLADVLIDVLKPIQERRKIYEKDIPGVFKIIEEGTKKANIQANKVLDLMKKTMGINYFNNSKFIETQTKSYQKKLKEEQDRLIFLSKQKKN